ncbi:phosphodiester glycosidase family protein [Allorhizobium sonneratiae]|uniref:phosphodiester glycosidase family protein n=1 Tax=Allorhizobium sonneratiae TaxID=2934936 RepID=UPI002033E802|nr:phosphodiester glycosidase family protein [Allorhizobium sonneratiae]
MALMPVPVMAQTGFCHDWMFRGVAYRICRFDPRHDMIRLYDHAPDGIPYAGFDRLQSQLSAEGRRLVFGMNGGMYLDNLDPAGLFIANGMTLKPAVTGDGWGNFYLKPNGVFYREGRIAGVMETQAFLNSGISPDMATQSGPMLVIDGRIHPRFLPDSDSLKIRNGVGVDDKGDVIFVLSEDPVRFYDMALLFRDDLHTPNALFLDGSISAIAEPQNQRIDRGAPLGPILAVIADDAQQADKKRDDSAAAAEAHRNGPAPAPTGPAQP